MKSGGIQFGDEIRFYANDGFVKRKMKVDICGKALSTIDYERDGSYRVKASMTGASSHLIKYEHFHPNKNLAHRYYTDKNGGRINEESAWFENGNVRFACRYGRNAHNEAIPVGDYREYYPNGQTQIEAHFDAEDGKFSGRYTEYWENGNVKKDCHYGREIVKTLYKQILNHNYYEGHDNGKPSKICSYALNGQRNSPLYMYDEEGNPTYEVSEKDPVTGLYLHKKWENHCTTVIPSTSPEPDTQTGRGVRFHLEEQNGETKVFLKMACFFEEGKNISGLGYYISHMGQLFTKNTALTDKDRIPTLPAKAMQDLSMQFAPAN